MTLSEEQIRIFNDSLDRCIASPRFLRAFYDRFIGGSEEVAAKFRGTDMKRQRRALKASLYTAMLAADGNRPALKQLEWLRDRHHGLEIEDEHYELWQSCLLAAVRECGGDFDVRVEGAWRDVLQVAIGVMKSPVSSTID